jgi:environmental stress-induced protein Ves
VWHDETRAQLDADVVLLFCAQGELLVTTGDHAHATTLVSNDTLRIDNARALSCDVKGKGALLAVSIRYTDTSQA